ncbi:serine hydrolase [Aureisphaera galaxeae]|uniref:serine hydrolase domain-containing protein n=1 Tax=Aureisphaera galaxeae TaxID=1538023 RepID=UPI0023500FEC|nr:serine hydrolase domain-containing protein [Aureisphaera galaxeae]MDC8004079.1 serine hydrolase [Aureisphaera galaxeae]
MNPVNISKILFLVTALCIMSSCYAQTLPTKKGIVLHLDSLVKKQQAERNIPSLAVGIVKDGKVVLAKGYGYANVEEKIKADGHTVYQLGSVTKMFTGHLLASLILQDKMQLSDTLSNYFPTSLEFPVGRKGQVVTIRDIATHSSEFPRYPVNLKRTDPYPIDGYSKEELLKGISRVKLRKEIGKKYKYSNFGYGVLGIAMENRMGKELSGLMHDEIFSKYGMNNSSLMLNEGIQQKLATPYLEVSPLTQTEPWNMEALAGAGNLFSSVTDLTQFMLALLKEGAINKIQQTPYLQINDSWSYGLGCFIVDSKKRNTPVIYHGGDIDGYASSLSLYPEYGLGFVILTNWGEGQSIGQAFETISKEIVDHYLGKIDD